jgi:hypothetical protein
MSSGEGLTELIRPDGEVKSVNHSIPVGVATNERSLLPNARLLSKEVSAVDVAVAILDDCRKTTPLNVSVILPSAVAPRSQISESPSQPVRLKSPRGRVRQF